MLNIGFFPQNHQSVFKLLLNSIYIYKYVVILFLMYINCWLIGQLIDTDLGLNKDRFDLWFEGCLCFSFSVLSSVIKNK